MTIWTKSLSQICIECFPSKKASAPQNFSKQHGILSKGGEGSSMGVGNIHTTYTQMCRTIDRYTQVWTYVYDYVHGESFSHLRVRASRC